MTLNPRIAFAGTPANAARTLEALVAGGFEVGVVITREDAPVGRKQVLTASPVAEVAARFGIPVIKANRIDEGAIAELAKHGCSLGVVVAYGALLKHPALDALSSGWFNLHYSLLPKWRGASPVQAALAAGDRETGVTLFRLDEGMDTGGIVGTVETLINPHENAGELLARLTELGITLLLEQLPLIQAGLATERTQTEGATHCGKLSRAIARIDWSRSAIEIENGINAYNPEPGAWTTLLGDQVKVLAARALGATDWAALSESATAGEAPAESGSVSITKSGALVHCGSGTLLELREIQPAGKKPMPASDWARGIAGREVRFE
ncbi:MAG: hypothetical protein RLZZ626_269 [Actinomycetota bacterium]